MQTSESPSLPDNGGEEMTTQLSSLSQGTRVYGQDGELGQVDCFITDPVQGEQITHVVIRRGVVKPEYTPVPISLVHEINAEGLYLRTTREGLKGMNEYIWPELPADEATPDPNQVYEGPNQEKILSHALALRAVVAEAISQHPVTKDAVIEVANDHGIITLLGSVANTQVRQTAETISAQQPGVISVVNSLKVKSNSSSDTAHDAQILPFAPVVNPSFVER